MLSADQRLEIRRLLALGGPVAVTQLGTMMLGVVDTMMVGHVSMHALDAAALGTVWVFGTLVFGQGLLWGMDPYVSQAQGAGDRRMLGVTLQRGLVLAVAISLPLALAWLGTESMLVAFGQPPSLAEDAQRYVTMQIPGLLPFLIFTALRSYLQGRGLVAPALWVVLAANLVNVVGNWVLVFGNLGAPALGIEGAGIATSITRVFLCVAMALWLRGFRLHEGGWVPWSRAALDPAGFKPLLWVGVPLAVQLGLELWAFQGATLLAGWLGPTALAAHVVVLNLASLSFMVPLGLSQGAATRIGNLIGAADRVAAQRSAMVALGLGATVMSVSAVCFIALRKFLPTLYGDDPGMIALAASVLPVAAAFQLFDGTQVVGCGILRGMGDTRPAAVFNLVGYYGLALPLAGWLAFGTDVGLAGIWWGLCAGLATVASALVWWLTRRGPAFTGVRPNPGANPADMGSK